MRHKLNYPTLKRRADAYARSVNDRARALCYEAGLDGSLLGIHPHNAMVSLHYGEPWPEVDYKKCRKVIWLTDDVQWRASRVLDRLCSRLGYEAFTWK
jgi:hypothetical protein